MINIKEKEAEAVLINKFMTSFPLLVANSYNLIFMISNLMKERKVSSIIIFNQDDQNYHVGLIAERDIVRRVISNNKDPTHTKATEIMSKQIISYETDTYLYNVFVKIVKNKISLLTVVNGNKLFGIGNIRDIIKYFYEKIKILILFPKL